MTPLPSREDSTLAPCPFCGGEAYLTFAMGEHWVTCRRCLASPGMSGNEPLAVEKWNRRRSPASTDRDGVLATEQRIIAETREILAGADAGSLPHDWTLQQVAAARIEDIVDLRWKVRDTCARAEKAEAALRRSLKDQRP